MITDSSNVDHSFILHINIEYTDYVCIRFQFDVSIFLEIEVIIKFVSFLVSYDSIIVANQ